VTPWPDGDSQGQSVKAKKVLTIKNAFGKADESW
jgi:hypothetical protein